MQVFPIWISEIPELDLVYEGLHEVYVNLNSSHRYIQKRIGELDRDLAEAIFETDEGPIITEIAQEIASKLRDQKSLLREVSKKIERVHILLKRLSDPSVPRKLVDEYHERMKQKILSTIIERSI